MLIQEEEKKIGGWAYRQQYKQSKKHKVLKTTETVCTSAF